MRRLFQIGSLVAVLFCAPAYAGPPDEAAEKPNPALANYWEARTVSYFRALIKAHARVAELEEAQRRWHSRIVELEAAQRRRKQ